MTYVEPRVSQTEALRFFERRRAGNLWHILHRDPIVKRGRLPYAELVWIPHYLIALGVNSSRGPGEIVVSVEAHSGAFTIVEGQAGLVEGTPEGEAFPPRLAEDEAIKIGRKELLKSIMRRRGQRHKPVIQDTRAVSLFHYPYWVYYFERRRGLLDIAVADAVTCDKGRARTKVGVLSALASHESSQCS